MGTTMPTAYFQSKQMQDPVKVYIVYGNIMATSIDFKEEMPFCGLSIHCAGSMLVAC